MEEILNSQAKKDIYYSFDRLMFYIWLFSIFLFYFIGLTFKVVFNPINPLDIT